MLFNQQLVLLVTVLLVCLSWNRVVTAQFLFGDNCIVKHNEAPGQCKRLIICPNDLNDMRYNRIQLIQCDFVAANLQQTICCAAATVTTTDPVPNGNNIDNDSLRVRKCKTYAKSVYETETVAVFGEGSVTINVPRDKCGYNPGSINEGTTAQAREFPYSALLGFTLADGTVYWGCGGSLVSSRYVLTAGNCLNWPYYGEVSVVRLGELNINSNTDDASPIDIRVSTKIPHPDYNSSSHYNDIALLKLAQQVKLSPYIRPICLPTEALPPAHPIATTWGLHTRRIPSKMLLKFEVESFSNDECNRFYEIAFGALASTETCAKLRDQAIDMCQDHGSPLQIYHPAVYCMYIQTAITSFGVGCGRDNRPELYTKVYDYADWIESIIWGPGEDE